MTTTEVEIINNRIESIQKKIKELHELFEYLLEDAKKLEMVNTQLSVRDDIVAEIMAKLSNMSTISSMNKKKQKLSEKSNDIKKDEKRRKMSTDENERLNNYFKEGVKTDKELSEMFSLSIKTIQNKKRKWKKQQNELNAPNLN